MTKMRAQTYMFLVGIAILIFGGAPFNWQVDLVGIFFIGFAFLHQYLFGIKD